MSYVKKINALVDELYEEGVSILVVATSNAFNDDGYYRVASPEHHTEELVLNELLSGSAKATDAIRERIKEIEG